MVYLRSNQPPHVAYGNASASHAEASAAALAELASICSSAPWQSGRRFAVKNFASVFVQCDTTSLHLFME